MKSMYEVKIGDQWIEADDLKGALSAAYMVSAEIADHFCCPARMIRKEIIIVRDGTYDGRATEQAWR